MKIFSSLRVVLLALGLGLMALLGFEASARAQSASDFTTSSDGSGGLIIIGYTGTVTAVVIPGTINNLTVTQIGSHAFQGQSTLASVTIPSCVASIGQHAFFDCTALTDATFDGDAPSMGNGVFAGTAAGFAVTYYAYATGFGSPWSDGGGDTYTTNSPLPSPFQVSFSPNQVTITGYTGSVSALDIPSDINGLPVVAIGTFAFTGSTFASVFIPGSVTNIETEAFAQSNGLTTVNIPATVTTIGIAPFEQCFSLTAITVDPANPNYMSTADGVLLDKNEFTLINFPTGRSGAYTLPATVTSIAGHAFLNSSLTSVVLPAGLTSIGNNAFYYSDLLSVTLPSQLATIGIEAFVGCGLSSVTIPPSVNSIGGDAFANNGNLASAVFDGNAPTMGSTVFAHTASGFTVYYYQGATGFTEPTWNDGGGDTYPSAMAPDFDGWIASYPSTPDSSPTATPEDDGVPNLLKYLYDIDPSRPMTEADRTALPVFSIEPATTSLGLMYRQYALENGITINVQTSTNLQTWTTLTSAQYTKVPTGVQDSSGNPYMKISVPFTGSREFIRMNVTQP